MDGTFGTVAFPFYQILITRTKVVNRPFTTSFSLLPNKKKTTYESAIHQIKETVTREGYMWDPSTVHVDCEVGLYKAVRRVFPGIDTKLCWFHTSDAQRKTKGKLGLLPLIRQNKSLKWWTAKLNQMNWVPPTSMPKVWALLWDQLDDSMKENAKVLEMKQYMERNWVPTSLPLKKNAKRFDVLMTNHFDTVDGETNNNISEGYNARLKIRFGNHPNLF